MYSLEDRSQVITIGGMEHKLILTTKATKDITKRYGGLEKLGDKLLKNATMEESLGEVIWLIALLANQEILIHNLQHRDEPKRNDLGKIENHIFFFDDIKELSVGASNFADLKPHATFHRGIGSYTFCYEDEKTYGTLTNMMGVILVTLYHKGQREVWNNTEILNGVGRIEAKDQQIQSVFGNELIHIMETAKKASEAMSVAQQKKAEDRIKAAGEDVKNYSVFQDWMNDMDLKNRITDK